jgi:hypothetical protein
MKKLILLLFVLPSICFADAIDDYKNTCRDIGFKPGTEKFGDCVLKLKKKDVQVQTDNAEQQKIQYLQQQLNIQKQLADEQIRASKAADERAKDAERWRLIQQGLQMMEGPKPQTQTYQFNGGPPVTCTTLNGLTSCN